MSEVINTIVSHGNMTRYLLASASALALLASVSTSADATEDPPVWIELGAQLEHATGDQEKFSPAFLSSLNSVPFESPLDFQNSAPFSNGAEGKISFEPGDSGWIFSASVRYGRSNGERHVHQQTPNAPSTKLCIGTYCVPKIATAIKANFADTDFVFRDDHTILDFSAGKDVGLGLFGGASRSTFGLGVRFAQFRQNSTVELHAIPDRTFPQDIFAFKYNHRYDANESAERSFHGVGPSLSANGSSPLLGTTESGEIVLDWGLNGAVLFGRQKAETHHQTTSRYYKSKFIHTGQYVLAYTHQQTIVSKKRTHSVTVPNLGGFAGLSVRYSSAKISFGYRADYFFNAMDGGIDTRKSMTRGFLGPFASISVGLGG